MKLNFSHIKSIALSMLAAFAIGAVSAQKPVKTISGKDTLITANRTWDCDSTYYLKGKVYVTNGAELTIQPGTVIVGDTINKGTLIITQGSKIHAVGKTNCPIVFTSARQAGRRNRGDWGGLIILGKSTLNTPTGLANIEGLPPSALTQYGGGASPFPGDNSGELRYVRVEYAGVALAPNNEINGITFGSVGSGTTVDHVQVSYSNDDSYEWFGGTMNAKYLIAFRGLDDDFDTDNGFSGKLQFGAGLRDPNVADVSGSNGFESDNDANSSSNNPQTSAVFSNFTMSAGSNLASNPNYRNGLLLRRNSHMYLYNSILVGFPTGGTIDGTTTQSNVLADTLIQNNIVTGPSLSQIGATTPSNPAVINLLSSPAAGNRGGVGGNTFVKLVSPFSLTNPDIRPQATSPALSGADFNHVGITSFFDPTFYVGAVSLSATENWTQEAWVEYTPNDNNYTGPCTCGAGLKSTKDANNQASVVSTPNVEVIPNPNNGSFTVTLKGFTNAAVNVKIADVNTGRVVYSKAANNNTVLSLNLNIPTGVYIVDLNDGTTIVTKKINVIK